MRPYNRGVSTRSPLIESLNPVQAEAVLHTEGPALIVAGAGSGKTRALTHRIAYLIREQGVNPYSILAITFTNKAAREMAERVESLLGERIAKGMWILTFHSACARILRREHDHLGLGVACPHLVHERLDRTLLGSVAGEHRDDPGNPVREHRQDRTGSRERIHARDIELAPAVFDFDEDIRPAGIDGILNEFLDDRGGALDHLAGRDSVHERRRELLDSTMRLGHRGGL